MKIAAYVRVSSHQQVQTQTIEQQLERLQTQSQSQGWPWQDVQIFRDDGVSRSEPQASWTGSST